MQINPKCRTLLITLLLFLQGCATTGLNQKIADFQRPPETIRFFEVLDRMVDEAEVRNAADFAVFGFPYLRTNRFLTGLKPDLDSNADKMQWIRWLQQLDMEARKKEISNLPERAIGELALKLGGKLDRQTLQDRVAQYSERIEYLIFLPMGIPDVGSMRQRGHHAVKLVGRLDFEDPDVFDKNFEFY